MGADHAVASLLLLTLSLFLLTFRTIRHGAEGRQKVNVPKGVGN